MQCRFLFEPFDHKERRKPAIFWCEERSESACVHLLHWQRHERVERTWNKNATAQFQVQIQLSILIEPICEWYASCYTHWIGLCTSGNTANCPHLLKYSLALKTRVRAARPLKLHWNGEDAGQKKNSEDMKDLLMGTPILSLSFENMEVGPRYWLEPLPSIR